MKRNANGPRMTKSALPARTCEVCRRPFEWRRKWARVWETVKYCSVRCRAAAGRTR
jgi:hypothetical protein